MATIESRIIPSGLPQLDDVIQGFRLGDNVVWKIDNLEDYKFFAEPFADRAIADGRKCVYIKFAPHEPVLEPLDGLEIINVDPGPGFDYFSGEVHKIIEKRGKEVFYVFDNISALVVEWATDELLANFFQVTCPFLFELDTVAFFALTRGLHSPGAVARIRDTTQVLISIYTVKDRKYLHPLKVWDRYSRQMFMPHMISDVEWTPVFSSGDAAEVATMASRKPFDLDTRSIAPWESVYKKLNQYRQAGGWAPEQKPEIDALKREFARMLIGSHPDFNKLFDRYFTIEDLFSIRDRLIGSGRIGGKAAGMLLARKILLENEGMVDFSRAMENHDSFYIGSDVFFTFLVNNDLFRLRLQLSSRPGLSWEEFGEIERRFLDGQFPTEIMEQFRNTLDYFGQAPIIVRSSSLLEDSFGNAFAGKYRSEYCANQGDPEERLEAFTRAVKIVFASALNPDALVYRRKRGLAESDEQMAILVQRVAGTPFKDYFFPTLAGVALSRNLYVWTNRIDPKKGLIRLVFGLGTRAVNRVGADYPRMIPVSEPGLRPETGLEIAKYSQREMDLLDLRLNKFMTRNVAEVLSGDSFPNLHLLVSVRRNGYLFDPASGNMEDQPRDMVLTFNNLIKRKEFVYIIGEMVAELEKAYRQPVETEFTAALGPSGEIRINLLQCRPMMLPGIPGPVKYPEDIEREKILFKSGRFISGGVIERIRYIIYIDPKLYADLDSMTIKSTLGRVVGQINERLRESEDNILVMGPGRWGSSNIDLGVNVTYADIDNASVLVEVGREEAGYIPEVSYGTHFFQDLVEAGIIYLPIYPDDEKTGFNRGVFESAGNILTELVPNAHKFEKVVRVIDVRLVTGGSYARVVADPVTQRAVCYLA